MVSPRTLSAACAACMLMGCTPAPTTMSREPLPLPSALSLRCPEAPRGAPETEVTPATAFEAFATAMPGEHFVLRGVFTDELVLPSGVAGSPIVLRGDGATLRHRVLASGAHDVVLRDLAFINDGSRSWLFGERAARIDLVGNVFDVDCIGCGGEFRGLLLGGEDITFCGNRVGVWVGDTVSFRPADRVLVQDNDFSEARSDHGVLLHLGSDLVVRGNVFRNRWDRVLHIASLEPDIVNSRAVIEDNVFLDSGNDPDVVREGVGDSHEVVRLIGAEHIFRNNLVVGSRRSNEAPCHAALAISTFEDPPHWRNLQNRDMRIYNNTFVDTATNAITFEDAFGFNRTTGNQVTHNVFARTEEAELGACTQGPVDGLFTAFDNLFSENARARVEFRDPVPFDEAVELSTSILENHRGEAVFRDESTLVAARAGPLRPDSTNTLIAGFELASPIAASPLTRVREDSEGELLAVNDALPFSDGRGVVEGDLIRVGDVEARVVQRLDRQTLELDRAIVATRATPVFIAGLDSVGVSVPTD